MTDSGPPTLTRLRQRSDLLRAVRNFFYDRAFLEVETPVRIPAPPNEAFLEAPPSGPRAWLRTSPELHMKRLLAAGTGPIFQIGPCFRQNERGARHNPEFTMLEWYRPNETIESLYADVEALCHTLGLTHPAPFPRHTLDTLYRRHAHWSPLETWDEDRFDTDMALLIEPALPQTTPCFLTGYPAQAAALARLSPTDPRIAERFEFYLNGIEIANAYGELTDPAAQRARFQEAAARRARHTLTVYPLDEPFLQALPAMPPSAGIALGLDRLAMHLSGATAIDQVRGFCPPIGHCW